MQFNVDFYNGTPTVFMNGEPIIGLMHWSSNPNPEEIALFRDINVNFFSFMGNISVIPPNLIPTCELEVKDGGLPRMLLTQENIDKTMNMLVTVNPHIKILPRIVMNPPVWWEKSHQEELMVYYNLESGKYIKGPRACLFSEKWNNTWIQALRNTIDYFEKQWGEFIIGYHTGLGHCGEHTYQWWNHVADFSYGHHHGFQIWLKKKYSCISELNKIWKTNFCSFDEVPLPDGKNFADFRVSANAIFLPEKEYSCIDFQEFASESMADILLCEAATVKNKLHELGRQKLYGAFYGYINLVANSTQATVGHSALSKVLRSPHIDFICGPLSYGSRQSGGTIMPQMITGSIGLHGKVFYNEDDTGTHVVQCNHHGYIPPSEYTAIHAGRRNFLSTLSSGGTQWWMDLYGKGWFIDKKIQREFYFLRQFAENHFTERRSCAEMAIFVSLDSTLHMRDNPVPLTGNLIEQQLFEIAASGAPFDIYQDEDIPLLAQQGKLEQYKFCVFLNSLCVKEDIRTAIKMQLQNNSRTILWFYAPGYVQGGTRSAKYSEDLCGITFSAVENGIMPMLTETWNKNIRISYGLSKAIYPRLTANDPNAAVRGYFVNATTIANQTNGSGAAFVEKNLGDWTSIWSASPGMPSCIIGDIAQKAGVHLFSERGDQIFYNHNWIGIHSKCSGKLNLALPELSSWKNLETKEIYPTTKNILLDLQRGQTAILERVNLKVL